MSAGENVGRARTALVRVMLRIAGVQWKDGDEEDAERYGMRVIFWRKWEAYGTAAFVGFFLVLCGVWMLGRMVDPGGWAFLLLLPVAVLGVFLAVQVVMLGGVALEVLAGKVMGRKISGGAGWVSAVALLVLTLVAVWMCLSGGWWGWGSGLFWLVPASANAGAWVVEKGIRAA